jgi:hypothetical protein
MAPSRLSEEAQQGLQRQVEQLSKQLEASVGLSGGKTNGANSSWDGSLAEAQRRLRSAAAALLDDEGDPQAERLFEGWSAIVSTHPDTVAAAARGLELWEAEQAAANRRAAAELLPLLPADIVRAGSKAALLAGGLPPLVAERLWRRRALWLLRTPPAEIARMHEVDLVNLCGHDGLDLRELRAVYAAASGALAQRDGLGQLRFVADGDSTKVCPTCTRQRALHKAFVQG